MPGRGRLAPAAVGALALAVGLVALLHGVAAGALLVLGGIALLIWSLGYSL